MVAELEGGPDARLVLADAAADQVARRADDQVGPRRQQAVCVVQPSNDTENKLKTKLIVKRRLDAGRAVALERLQGSSLEFTAH